MKYDGQMDTECILLCDAISKINGLKTYESCCGHGKSPFRVWFRAKEIDDLSVIVKAMGDRRYNGGCNWKLLTSFNDAHNTVGFYIESVSIGCRAYNEANAIAKYILEIIDIDKALRKSRMKKRMNK